MIFQPVLKHRQIGIHAPRLCRMEPVPCRTTASRASAVVRQVKRFFCDNDSCARGRSGDWELETWIKAAQASGIAPLASFATGPCKDWGAVVNGLTLPYSSGVVEGHVNRVIMWNLRGAGGRADPAGCPGTLLEQGNDADEHGEHAAPGG